MQNHIFSSASESFVVAHVIHIGPVIPLSEDKRTNGNTHYFRLTTVQKAAWCKFKNEEAARRSRGVIGAMLGTIKPHVFRVKGDSIDLSSIVSFGRIIRLKNDDGTERFGLPITLLAINEKSSTLWLTFKTEESAQNVRKALWAALMSYYSPQTSTTEDSVPATITESTEEYATEAEIAFTEN